MTIVKSWIVVLGFLALIAAASCTRIPEPDSPGGQIYAKKCAVGCHGAYQPSIMKFEMWKLMVRRMQGDMARHGIAPLTDEEERVLLDYLKRNSG